MRALKIVGPSKAEIQEVAEPEIGTGQVKVTVERAGICGSATEIGSGAEGIAVGDLVESTAVAWHAAKAGGVCKGSIVAIVGAGPVGLALILTSHALGAEKIVVSEPSEALKELAAQLGADVVDPRETDLAAYIRDTYGDGADVSFKASCAGAITLKAAVTTVRNGGTIVIVASSHGEVPIDLNTIMNLQKRLVGTLAYTNEDFAEVITAIADGTLDLSPLVSSTISLDDAIEKGLNHLLGEGRNSEVKILVRP